MDRYSGNQQMKRERAIYRYLDALDTGDMDTINEVLQQAIYDATLEAMLLEAHQEYIAEEQKWKNVLVNAETQRDIPTIDSPKPRDTHRSQHSPTTRRNSQKRSTPRWAYTLIAVLVVAVLIGSFVTLLNVRRSGTGHTGIPTPTASPTCQSYPSKQFDVPANALGSLNAVVALSTNDAWSVGYSTSEPGSTPVIKSPLIDHWNGKNWQVVSTPHITNGSGVLNAVAADSASDVWAVGYSYSGSNQVTPLISKTLVEHWDGQHWQIIVSPNGPAGNGLLRAVSVISQNDVWVVGAFEDASQTLRPLLEHWNGVQWQIVSLSADSMSGALNDVSAKAANDVWIVGESRNEGGTGTHGIVEHWNGTLWQQLPLVSSMSMVASVSVIADNNVYVIGADVNGKPLLETWNGQTWSIIALPGSLMSQAAYLVKIVAVTSRSIWIAGTIQVSDGTNELLLLHWNGASWQQTRIPGSQLSTTMPNSAALGLALYNGSQVWVVGEVDDADGGYIAPIALGQRTCP